MMDKRSIALIAAVGGLVVGIAGANLFRHAQAAPTNMVCITDDPAQDAKIDAMVKQLHSHDRDKYVPQHVLPIGVLPKPAKPAAQTDPTH